MQIQRSFFLGCGVARVFCNTQIKKCRYFNVNLGARNVCWWCDQQISTVTLTPARQQLLLQELPRLRRSFDLQSRKHLFLLFPAHSLSVLCSSWAVSMLKWKQDNGLYLSWEQPLWSMCVRLESPGNNAGFLPSWRKHPTWSRGCSFTRIIYLFILFFPSKFSDRSVGVNVSQWSAEMDEHGSRGIGLKAQTEKLIFIVESKWIQLLKMRQIRIKWIKPLHDNWQRCCLNVGRI